MGVVTKTSAMCLDPLHKFLFFIPWASVTDQNNPNVLTRVISLFETLVVWVI